MTEKYKMPMVEGNGADRGLFQQGYKYLFAVLNTSDYYLRAAVNILAEQTKQAGRDPKSVKIAIAIENDNFSQDVRDGIVEDAKKYGMQVVIDDKLPADLNDMTATLTKVKALKGPVIGAVIFDATQELFWTYLLGWQRVAMGLLIIVIVVFFPTGILGWLERKRQQPDARGTHAAEGLP